MQPASAQRRHSRTPWARAARLAVRTFDRLNGSAHIRPDLHPDDWATVQRLLDT